jgi:deoxyribonuclease-4
MSIAGGVDKAPGRAASVGCTALQIFVKNNRTWDGPPISSDEAARFRQELGRVGIAVEHVFAHTCYLINLASPKDDQFDKSVRALSDELRRCAQLGLPGLVMHPGAHTGSGREAGIARIADGVKRAFAATPEVRTRLLFEGTAGTGTNLGAEFEDLRDILQAIDDPARVGICLDTCHLLAAGHELRTREGYDETMSRFDALVGIHQIRAFHLNDSVFKLGSRKDRHEHIGKGHLGLEPFRFLLNDPRFAGIPMSLETDKGDDLAEDRMNLEVLRSLVVA